MRFFAIRDTDDVEKNLANQVTDFVWNIYQKDNRNEARSKYHFVGSRQKFLLVSAAPYKKKSDLLYIIPPNVEPESLHDREHNEYFKIDTDALMKRMSDPDSAVFFISPELGNDVDGPTLYRKLTAATIDRATGDFLSLENGTRLTTNRESKVALFGAVFKMGRLPIYVMLINSEFMENKCYDDYEGTNTRFISVLKESRSVKDEIFSPAYRKGFVTQIGKHEMFVHGDSFEFEVFGEYLAEIPSVAKAIYEDSLVYPHKSELPALNEMIKAYSNFPTKVDQRGVVSVDLSQAKLGDSGYLRIEIEAGEFFKYWIYKTHRSIYEFVLHKSAPIAHPDLQGTIHSPGFY